MLLGPPGFQSLQFGVDSIVSGESGERPSRKGSSFPTCTRMTEQWSLCPGKAAFALLIMCLGRWRRWGEPRLWGHQIPAPQVSGCVTWGHFPNFSEAQFLICKMELIPVSWGPYDSKQSLPCRKFPIFSISYYFDYD